MSDQEARSAATKLGTVAKLACAKCRGEEHPRSLAYARRAVRRRRLWLLREGHRVRRAPALHLPDVSVRVDMSARRC
jgi:hypothetical protein